MSKKLPVNKFEWVTELYKFNEDFIKNYDENGDVGYFLEVDIDYPKKLFDLHKDLPFLPERNWKGRKTCLCYRRQRKIHHSYKCFKTGIKSWIKI